MSPLAPAKQSKYAIFNNMLLSPVARCKKLSAPSIFRPDERLSLIVLDNPVETTCGITFEVKGYE
jgi:hypothetical protein